MLTGLFFVAEAYLQKTRPSHRPGGREQRLRHPRHRRLAVLVLACAGILVLHPSGAGGQAEVSSVLVTDVRGPITPVIADHLREALDRAESAGAVLLVEMDTPGGTDAAMREIVQAFLGARTPVILYVAPPGARAASAGAFIAISAHVAAMAPGTTIGAATPVDLEGSDVARKIVNDAVAYARSIARERGRNVGFAEDMVREARTATAEEAVAIQVVDVLADTRDELLVTLDGRTVETTSGGVTLRTAGAPVEEFEMGLFRRILQWLADPNLAFMFLSLGTLAILYELANPGIGAGGIVGLILILMALFALSVLPVNAVGVILILLAAALFVAELFVPGIGVFAAGGTASLMLGGIFLFRGSIGVDAVVLAPIGIVVGGGALAIGRIAWRSRRIPTVSGTGAVVGHTGIVRRVDGDRLQVVAAGSWWGARSAQGGLEVGQRVRVVDMEGLTLIVEAVEEEGT
ncbi:MAG: nodulation protein NfeD [Actinobacteria bacterium]|nr:nodulation protein NfeD [Actinomycetota bacterium]